MLLQTPSAFGSDECRVPYEDATNVVQADLQHGPAHCPTTVGTP